MSDIFFSREQLLEISFLLLKAGGLPEEQAEQISNDLVQADLRGLSSHGISRIPMYLNRIKKKVVNVNPKIKISHSGLSVVNVDGDDGMGFVVAHKAVEEGIAAAAKTGISIVGIHRSTHFGMSALYVNQAIDSGFNCLVWTNSSPALPAWGGKTTFLGAAPFAAGMVGGYESPPYILDMAMTVIARGKIRVAMTNGEKIQLGLALNKEGEPTTNAKEAFEGVCLPFGGIKGSALAMLMDLMAGLYTGANFGGEVKSLYYDHSEPQNVGHIFFFMKPDLFIPMETYKERMDVFYKRLKALPCAKGVEEIMMPGEPERRITEQRILNGIPISQQIFDDILAAAKEYSVELPKF